MTSVTFQKLKLVCQGQVLDILQTPLRGHTLAYFLNSVDLSAGFTAKDQPDVISIMHCNAPLYYKSIQVLEAVTTTIFLGN